MFFKTVLVVTLLGLTTGQAFGPQLERQQQLADLQEQLNVLQQQINQQTQQMQSQATPVVNTIQSPSGSGQMTPQQTIQNLEQQLQVIQAQQQQRPQTSLLPTQMTPTNQVPIAQQSPMNILEQMMDQINIQTSAESNTNPASPSTPTGMTQFLRNIVMFFMRFMQNFMNMMAQNPRIITDAANRGIPEETKQIIDSITTGIEQNSFNAGLNKFRSGMEDLKRRQRRSYPDATKPTSKPFKSQNLVQDWSMKIVDTLLNQFMSGDIRFKKGPKN